MPRPRHFRLGRKPKVFDPTVPRFSLNTRRLPPPPDTANWYAEVGQWPMFLNDRFGDCTCAGAFHAHQELSCYAGDPQIGTDDEVLDAYRSVCPGFDPDDPKTDVGALVLGPSGMMARWRNEGFTIAGQLNKVGPYLQITRPNPVEWKQAIYYFGGLLAGINVPNSLFSEGDPPYLWSTVSGGFEGGHEIWINGYTTVRSGYTTYDIVSWGQMYRVTEDFLQKTIEEAVVLIDPVAINAKGVDAAGRTLKELEDTLGQLGGTIV